MKIRYIWELICLVDNLLQYAEEENSDGILFKADIEKPLILLTIILVLQL